MIRSQPPLLIGGAGGGKGGAPRAASEATNTLRSKQIAHVIDMLGEGEWEGLIDGPAGVYLDDVQLFTPSVPSGQPMNFDQLTNDAGPGIAGTWNFQGVSIEYRPGTQSQTAIKTSPNAGSVRAVNSIVTTAIPITASITNTEYDTVAVELQVDALYQQNVENGDISGWFVEAQIQARVVGGSFATVAWPRIEGKSMSPYSKAYALDLHAIHPTGPWEIRVVRVSPDDADSSKHSILRFLGMNLMTSEKFRYPNSVLVALGFDASQFSNIPVRSYDVKMARIRVPVNYNPITRVYTGVWNGAFKSAWSDNPAWCLYEMATNPRFGLGEYFDESLFDKWTLYTIGAYCDQLVPNGFGGTEPRFTFNAFFQTQDDAITVLQNMAAVFRGIVFYMGGMLEAVQDAPSDPVYAFNTTNVVDGKFNYAGASLSARHTVAMVVWNNPELQYKQDIEYVEDPDGLRKFGYRPITVQALGCTSRGQAHRLGAWTLYVEQNEADVVTFSTSIEATGVQPGNVVEIYDPTRAGVRLGGRIIAIAGSVVTTDKGVTVPAGTHTLSYIADSGQLVTRTITTAAGTFSTLTLNAGASPLPTVGSIFGIETASVFSQLFRIISITEDNKTYEITAVSHEPSKYGYIENNLVLQRRPTSVTDLSLSEVSNVRFTETMYFLADETVGLRLSVSWDQVNFAMGYMVSWRRGANNWSTERLITANEMMINPVTDGMTYDVRIAAVSAVGSRSKTCEYRYFVVGEKEPPPPFDYFTCVIQPDGTRQFSYGYDKTKKPIDFKGARIRYFPGLVTVNWENMVALEGDGFYSFSPFETNQLVAGSYTLAACAEDRTKNLSTPLFIQLTLPDRRLGRVLVEFNDALEGWPATKVNCMVAGAFLEPYDYISWDNAPATWDAWNRWIISPMTTIVYQSFTRDLKDIVTGKLDMLVIADGAVTPQYRSSFDQVTWTGWLDPSVAFTGRYLQVAATVSGTVPILRSLSYTVSGQVRSESINDLNIAALTGANRIGVGDIRVPLKNAYAAINKVSVVAIQDTTPGWTWLLVDKATTGPHIKFYLNGVLADPHLVDIQIDGV